MNDRAITTTSEAPVTRPGCPAWCSNVAGVGSCQGEHETGMTDVAATAGGPIDVDLPGQFPTVGLGVWKYDDEFEPYAILSLDHLGVNAKMRPHELRQLAELATRLADTVEGVTR